MKWFYVWMKPAFFSASPLDHTWVTAFDAKVAPHGSLSAVITAGSSYWFCWGSFHVHSTTKPIVLMQQVLGKPESHCLVPPNDEKSRGTIHVYGVHGVCHQVSNQVLFPTGARVQEAKGYRFSSAVYGTYGTTSDEWDLKRMACGVDTPFVPARRYSPAVLYNRARRFFGPGSSQPRTLMQLRRGLLERLELVGLQPRGPEESAVDRAGSLNQELRGFATEALEVVRDSGGAAEYILGIQSPEQADLVDPEYFRFPDGSPPEGGATGTAGRRQE